MMHAGNQRAKMRPMGRAAGGQRQSSERPAMKCTVKSDDMLALGMIARELDCGFDGLGAGVCEKYFFRLGTRRQTIELLR